MAAAGERAGVYAAALGAAFDELHPRLRAYFSRIPEGSVGRGTGVFERVGTRAAWLRPLVAVVFDRQHALTPRWAADVPFAIENAPSVAGPGTPAVTAVRRIAFDGGEWAMVDEIRAAAGGVRDVIGSPPRLDVLLDVRVAEGDLTMRSRSTALILGRRRVPLPRFLAPTVVLTESWDDDAAEQRVSVSVHAPLLGTIYEYEGTFGYWIETAGKTT